MNLHPTPLPGLLLLAPRVFEDARGYFFESYSARDFDLLLPGLRFVQDNEARSSRGVLRGLHFQRPPRAQAKLVRVVVGRVLDVAVDLRPDSPAFGRHFSVELSGDNKLQLFIPRGFAHGYIALSDEVVLQYKCDQFYAPDCQAGIRHDDPDLAIDWRTPPALRVLSDKDRELPSFRDISFE